METTFTAKGYQPGQVRARYVRANVKGGDYSWSIPAIAAAKRTLKRL